MIGNVYHMIVKMNFYFDETSVSGTSSFKASVFDTSFISGQRLQ